jgi:hypothetical protein
MGDVKHTPGPWICRQQFANRWLIEKDQGVNADGEKLVPLGIASVHSTILEVGCSGPTDANARLIAAAPALLEALKALHERYVFAIGNEGPEAIAARMAISAATGSAGE